MSTADPSPEEANILEVGDLVECIDAQYTESQFNFFSAEPTVVIHVSKNLIVGTPKFDLVSTELYRTPMYSKRYKLLAKATDAQKELCMAIQKEIKRLCE